MNWKSFDGKLYHLFAEADVCMSQLGNQIVEIKKNCQEIPIELELAILSEQHSMEQISSKYFYRIYQQSDNWLWGLLATIKWFSTYSSNISYL